MGRRLTLGRIWGIPVGLHWSWLIIFFLVTISLGGGYFYIETPLIPVGTRWLLGLLSSLLFFASVLVHEFGHALLALHWKIPVVSIHLFLFGGVAQISQEPRTARSEFEIAVAGPLTSLGLAALFGIISVAAGSFVPLAAPARWLAGVNLTLALFNMIPGFPLDGGRVLRSLLWGLSRNFHVATRLASTIGLVIAYGFIMAGVWQAWRGDMFNGIWLVLIGLFLRHTTQTARAYHNMQHALERIQVGDVTGSRLGPVPGHLSIAQIVYERLLPDDRSHFLVSESGKPRGALSLAEITAIPRQEWPSTTAEQVMIPWACMVQAPPDMSVLAAIQALDAANRAQLVVVTGSEVTGIVSRDRLVAYLQEREQPPDNLG